MKIHLLMLVAIAALAGAGCRTQPAEVPLALERALQRGDRASVLALVDSASRPFVEAAMASAPTQKRSPYLLSRAAHPLRLVRTEAGEAGYVVTVEADGQQRDWVLLAENGAWKVDLAATASRRAWDTTVRGFK